MQRRDFLRDLLGAAAGVAVGLPGIAKADSLCGTGAWGEITCGDIWAGTNPASKLLDIHIMGGMAPWESLYYRPDGGRTRGFDSAVEDMFFSNDAADCGIDPGNPSFADADLSAALGGLDLTTLDAYDDNAFLIGNDDSGKPVHLGPFALPLRLHRKMWEHLRVVVLAHDLGPHEAAIPLALAGKRLGRPNFCGLGAPISRAERAKTEGGHVLPYSYALLSPFAATFPAFGAFSSEGGHGGPNKPLVLKPGPDFETFVARLLRNNIQPGEMNSALAWYRSEYLGWLTHSGIQARAPAFNDHVAAIQGLVNHQELHGLLDGGPAPIADSVACTGTDSNLFEGSGITHTSLRLAAHLLTRELDESSRYVGLVDEGLEHSGLMEAYDVHNNNSVSRTSRNFWNLLAALTSVVNDFGENDPNKIDLETTMIVLSTEFGRTPYRSTGNQPNQGSNGRDHWPQGYAIMLIGGPIQDRGVVGSLTDGEGVDAGLGEISYNPTDVRAACLIGQGIYPFEGNLYQVGRITPALQGTDPATSHADTMANLRTKILGVS